MLPSLLPSVIYQPSSLSPLSPLFRLILQPLQLTKKGKFKRLLHPSPPGFSLSSDQRKEQFFIYIVFNYLFSLSLSLSLYKIRLSPSLSRVVLQDWLLFIFLEIKISLFSLYTIPSLSLFLLWLPSCWQAYTPLSLFSFTSWSNKELARSMLYPIPSNLSLSLSRVHSYMLAFFLSLLVFVFYFQQSRITRE